MVHKKLVNFFSLGKSYDANNRERLWSMALSIDAFACHFLTDSFSSGHIRFVSRNDLNLAKLLSREQRRLNRLQRLILSTTSVE